MPSTCLIIPCYNEAARLDLDAFIHFYDKTEDVHLYFVDDGSKDHTIAVLNKLHIGRKDRIRVIRQPRNRGKAAAIRAGVNAALSDGHFDFIAYLDADLAIPLHEFKRLKEILEQRPDCQMVFASRIRTLGANIERTLFRHLLGRVFATAASLSLKLPVYDTQCGLKIFRSSLARSVFEDPFLSRWLFDVEIFFRASVELGHDNLPGLLLEIPLKECMITGKTKIRKRYLVRAPFDLIRIHRKYRRLMRESGQAMSEMKFQ